MAARIVGPELELALELGLGAGVGAGDEGVVLADDGCAVGEVLLSGVGVVIVN